MSDKPVFTAKDGRIEVAMWERNGQNGPFPGFSLKVSWKDTDSGEWQSRSVNLDEGQLLETAELLQESKRAARKFRAQQSTGARADVA